jgi:branched-chain amino acid transport system substrate-binding protein
VPRVVTIGFTGPLTGPAAGYGDDVRRGIALAIDEIDAMGGVVVRGRRVTFRLDALDDRYRPIDSEANARRLIRERRTPVVFCPYSAGIFTLLAFNTRKPAFIVGAYASDPAIVRQGNAAVVMIAPRFDAYFAPWVAAEMKRFGTRLALLPTSSAYGDAWKTGFGDAWKDAGGSIVGDDTTDYRSPSFADIVRLTLSQKPDVILVGGPSAATARVIDTARTQGYRGGFVANDQADLEAIAGVIPLSRLDGTVGAAPLIRFTGPGLRPFLAAYAKAYGSQRAPTADVALNDLTMHAFARAMELAQSTSDTRAIRARLGDALRTLPKNEQVLVPLGISQRGLIEFDLPSEIVQKGAFRNLSIPPLP